MADIERVFGILELELKWLSQQAGNTASQLNLAKTALSHREELQR